MVHTLSKEVMALNEKGTETDKLIEGRFRKHELAEVTLSMPGIGGTLDAELPGRRWRQPGCLPHTKPARGLRRRRPCAT